MMKMENHWAKAKIDSLFFHWLSSEPGVTFVKNLAEDVKSGNPIVIQAASNIEASSPQKANRKLSATDSSGGEQISSIGSPNTSSGLLDSSSSPSSTRRNIPRKKAVVSTSSVILSSSQISCVSSASSQPSKENYVDNSDVPTFYVSPGSGKSLVKSMSSESDSLENRFSQIQEIFKNHPDGIGTDEFIPVCKGLLQLPSALSVPLFRRIRAMNRVWRGEPISSNAAAVEEAAKAAELHPKIPYNPAWISAAEEEQLIELENGRLTEQEMVQYWKREVEPYDKSERFFRLVKKPNAKFIEAKDFFLIVRELIDGHPGLEFLESTPEFQEKYARTVVARIMHRVNTSWTGEITLRELRKSDLLHYLGLADEEEEINAINEYFSYEHFYVIYCKFWELDSDHDFLLSREDLFRYGGHSLTKVIVDRIFQQPCRSFTSKVKGKMGFEDFCFFILCEEDKTNATSIRYWFSLVDGDGDGYLRQWEIRLFYDEQLKRMKSLGHEEVTFHDVLCQMKDCLGKVNGKSLFGASPDDEDSDWVIGLAEFLKPDRMSISGSFFNLLFNLNKFVASESRDPFSTRLMQGDQPMTDWDRYALAEYVCLASA